MLDSRNRRYSDSEFVLNLFYRILYMNESVVISQIQYEKLVSHTSRVNEFLLRCETPVWVHHRFNILCVEYIIKNFTIFLHFFSKILLFLRDMFSILYITILFSTKFNLISQRYQYLSHTSYKFILNSYALFLTLFYI